GLDRDRGDPGAGGDAVDQRGHTARAAAAGVQDPAAADHVVDHDHRAGTGQPDRVVEVPGVVRLVGVDEDEVERLGAAGHQGLQAAGGRADPDLGQVAEPGPVQVGRGHLGVVGAQLERDELAGPGD